MSVVNEYIDTKYINTDSYFKWLTSYVADNNKLHRYSKLLRCLFSIPYRPWIGNDIDRQRDAHELRERYCATLSKNLGLDSTIIDGIDIILGECNILETLIAISIHMYDIMQDSISNNSASRWFWEIMNVSGLDIIPDVSWLNDISDGLVEHLVNYIQDGDDEHSNGWFGIYQWNTMELWYQMHHYLNRYFQ